MNSEHVNIPEDYKPVRFGIAGCGGITPTILRGIEEAKELEVMAVMDIDPDAASRIASEFNIPKHFTNYSEFLKEDIEVVVINSPNHCHHSQTMEAFDTGKHCLVQKPLARNVSEAQPMVDAADRAGLLLGVVMLERMDPIYRQFRDMCHAGCFGTITAVRCFMSHLNHLTRPPQPGTWRCSPEKIGGGSFIQLAIHHLDLAQWILGREIIEVAAISSSVVKPDMFPEDETTGAVVKFEGGAVGLFISSFTSFADEIEFRGTGGMIYRNEEKVRWKLAKLFDGELWDTGRVDELHEVVIPELANLKSKLAVKYEPHQQFALAVRGLADPEVPGKVGLQDLRVVDAVRKSVDEKRTVSLGR